ncbi:MAG: hypothetical protein JSR80_06205 [Verrucomicrobia bacterium]|nr:hypothetical protein [Verrucomicrobiota bacterium]
MKKTTFRAALAAAGLLLLGASPQVAADNCCNPCNDSCCWNPCACDGDFEIGAHALLFQPSTCRYDFAQRAIDTLIGPGTTQTIPGAIGTIDPDLDWGFRVWGDYIQDCMFVGVGYEWFQANDSARLDGPAGSIILRDNVTGLDSATGNVKWRYQNVDVRVGGIKSSCNGEMYGFINGRWIDLEHKRHARGVGFTTQTNTTTLVTQHGREKAQFQGGALGIGVGGRRNLLCDFGVIGELNILGVIGKRQTTATFENISAVTTTATGVIATTDTVYAPGYKSVTNVTPELDFRVGLDYTWCCDCWTIIGEVGYELDYFWNVFDFPQALNPGLTNRTSGSSWRNDCDDVGFSGLFFGLRALF